MIRTQVYIPDDLYKEAQLYAKLDKTSISEYIREGLKLSIERKKKKSKSAKKSFLSLAGKYSYGKGKTNAAATHNDIYDL